MKHKNTHTHNTTTTKTQCEHSISDVFEISVIILSYSKQSKNKESERGGRSQTKHLKRNTLNESKKPRIRAANVNLKRKKSLNNIEQTKNRSCVHSCNTSNKIRTVFHTKLNLERKRSNENTPISPLLTHIHSRKYTHTWTTFPKQDEETHLD